MATRSPKDVALAELRQLAAGNFDDFERCYQRHKARYPGQAFAMQLRAQVLERAAGIAAAVDFVLAEAERHTFRFAQVRFVARLLVRAERTADAFAFVARHDDPAQHDDITLLALELWLLAGGRDGFATAFDNLGDQLRGDPRAKAWRAAAAEAGQHPDAVLRFVEAIEEADNPAALLPAVHYASRRGRQYLYAIIADFVAAKGTGEQMPQVLVQLAHELFEAGEWAKARAMVEPHGDDLQVGDKALLLAAECAKRLGDHDGARVHLATVALRHAPPESAALLYSAFRNIIFDGARPKRLTDLAIKLPNVDDTPRNIKDFEDFVEGRTEDIVCRFDLDAFLETQDFVSLMLFCAVCVEGGHRERLRDVFARLPEELPLNRNQLDRLRLAISGFGDQDAKDKLLRNVLRTVPPSEPEHLFLRLELARGAQVDAAARDCVGFLETGRPAVALHMALFFDAPRLLSRIADPQLRDRIKAANEAFGIPEELSQLSMVEGQRQLCRLAQLPLPEPAAVPVSIITPVHRAEDLPNLRDNIARQTWPNLETIVVANGELFQSAQVAAALDGIDNVSIIHRTGSNVGFYLNEAIRAASGDYIVRFDADDIYFDDYVTSSIKCMVTTGAELSGRHSCFVYIEAVGRIFMRMPKPYYQDTRAATYYGVGATHIFRKHVFDEVQYLENIERGEDYLFFENATRRGFLNLNLDPFNFLIVRRAQKERHTWFVEDLEVLGNVLCYVGGVDVLPLLGMPERPAHPIVLNRPAPRKPEGQ